MSPRSVSTFLASSLFFEFAVDNGPGMRNDTALVASVTQIAFQWAGHLNERDFGDRTKLISTRHHTRAFLRPCRFDPTLGLTAQKGAIRVLLHNA